MILEAVRAGGGFRVGSPCYIGEQALRDTQDAFRSEGYELDADGVIRPALLDNVDEAKLPDALRHHVKRIRRGATDAALVTGEGKDFLEATARVVVVEKTGSYNEKMGFPGTLYQAFDLKGLATPPGPLMQAIEADLDPDPRRRLEQTLYLAAVAVNKLRNAQGVGHGRPFPPNVSDLQAQAAVDTMAIVSELLLETP
jgi:Abortive infection C-terminus